IPIPFQEKTMFPEQQAVTQVKETTKGTLLSMPNVVGVGVGFKSIGRTLTDQLGIIVLVRRKLPVAALSPDSLLPKQVDGVKVDVIEVGEIRALQARTGRWRPAPGGVSIGHYKITAGTLGVVVKDRSTGTRLILSNNHVLANSNDAAPGDPILQPGPYDGGDQDNDLFARLERFVPIEFTQSPGICGLARAFAGLGNTAARVVGSKHRLEVLRADAQAANLMDAAVARPVNPADLRDDILEIGVVSGVATAVLGMPVRK